MRGYEGFVDDAAPCMVGDDFAGVAVGGGEVRQAHGADIRCAARQRKADAGGAVREGERGCASEASGAGSGAAADLVQGWKTM